VQHLKLPGQGVKHFPTTDEEGSVRRSLQVMIQALSSMGGQWLNPDLKVRETGLI
jgi:hypothetical protein